MHYFVSITKLELDKYIPASQSDLRNNSNTVSLYFHSFITCSYIETITHFICLNIFSYAYSSTSFRKYHSWAWFTGRLERVTPRDRIGIMLVGALLMLQWTLFYASIKASSVSIGVVAFSSIGFFTALLEPLMTGSRVKPKEILFSCLTVLGIYLIFHFDTRYRLGIAFGLASAAAAAALAVFFRKYRAKYSSVTVMSWQLTGGFVSALALLPAYLALMPPQNVLPQPIDWLWLVIFSTFCTLGMYILQIQSLEKISAFTVNLSYNLEPVYSIVLAMILFGEVHELGLEFYGGLALICLSVALQTGSVLTTQRRLKRIAERKAREAQYRADPPND